MANIMLGCIKKFTYSKFEILYNQSLNMAVSFAYHIIMLRTLAELKLSSVPSFDLHIYWPLPHNIRGDYNLLYNHLSLLYLPNRRHYLVLCFVLKFLNHVTDAPNIVCLINLFLCHLTSLIEFSGLVTVFLSRIFLIL